MFDPISYKEARKVDEKHSLKSAQIEQDLKNYQSTLAGININQEAKQSVTGYGVVSLPKNCANGQVSAELRGQTASNLITNGDFSAGKTNWTNSRSNFVINNNIAELTATAQFGDLLSDKIKLFISHRYYVRARVKLTTVTDDILVGLSNINTMTYPKIASLAQTTNWQSVGGIVTINSLLSPDNRFFIKDQRNANFDAVMIDDIIVVDLTSTFGAGNEPDLATCDKMFANWFDGTKSTVSACRIKSVGKNLFDKNNLINNSWVSTTGILESSTTYQRTNPIRLKPNTIYTRKVEGGKTHGLAYFDIYGNYLARTGYVTATSTLTDTSPPNTHYGILSLENGTNFDSLSFVEGNLALTSYEPYTESNLYLNAGQPLRSLPNGIKDEISDGKLIKRVSDEYILDGNSGFKFLDSSFANTYRMVLDNWIVGKNVLLGTNGSGLGRSPDGDYPVRGNTVGTDVRSLVLATNNYLYAYIEKAKVDAMSGATTEDKFKAYLNQYPITLTYQLATPTITPISSSGTLLSNPSGTVYWEKAVADAGIYNDGVNVLIEDLPIASLDELSKVDFESGQETEIDPSQAVIASDGLSFTHPELQDGDIVFFTYYYDKQSIVPEMSVEFYDSRYVIKDSVTEKFYKWNVKVENGVPSIDLVEV